MHIEHQDRPLGGARKLLPGLGRAMFRQCVCGLLLAWHAGVAGARADAQQSDRTELETRFWAEAPDAWRRWEAKHGATCFDWRETAFDNARDEAEIRVTEGESRYRGSKFAIFVRKDERVRSEAWGGNERYLFGVNKASDEGPWTLGNFAPRTSDATRNGDARYGARSRDPFSIVDVPLYDLVADPKFAIESLQQQPDGSVELKFATAPRGTDDRFPQVTSGRIVLLPERDWAVSSCDVRLTRPARPDHMPMDLSASIEYGPDSERYVDIKRVVDETRWQQDGQERGRRTETEFTCRHCVVPDDAFELSAFDLPEPALPGDASPRRQIGLWLNLAAVLCLVVAVAVRMLLKAKAAR